MFRCGCGCGTRSGLRTFWYARNLAKGVIENGGLFARYEVVREAAEGEEVW
jgi:hypothetical protein